MGREHEEKIELKTFRDRGNIDVEKYLDEEQKYNNSFCTILEDEKEIEIKNKNCLDEVDNKIVIEQNVKEISQPVSVNHNNI